MNIFSLLLHNVKLTFRNILSQQLGNSTKEYDKCIVHYSLKNQLRYKGSLGKFFLFFYKFLLVLCFGSKSLGHAILISIDVSQLSSS